MTTPAERPIFFVGMPRGGTTVIHHAVALHERVGWLSNYSDKLPGSTLAMAMPRLYSLPGFRSKDIGEKPQHQRVSRFNRFLPKPTEAYATWSRWCGQAFVDTYMLGERAPDDVASLVRSKIALALRLQGRQRFIAKFTGPLRIGFLSSIFPGAVFVHAIRDPRAVIGSLLKVSFWREGGGLERPWWTGGLADDWEREWDGHGRTPFALAALQYRAVVTSGREEASALPAGRYVEVRYEDFVADPASCLSEMLRAGDLPPSPRAEAYVRSEGRYRNMNAKYIDAMDAPQRDATRAILGPLMDDLGYRFQE